MPINGSELINNPIITILSPFIDLLGTGFYLIPVSVIAGALFIQKKYDPTPPSLFMLVSGVLFGSGALFSGYGEMARVYYIFAGIGIASLFISNFFGRK